MIARFRCLALLALLAQAPHLLAKVVDSPTKAAPSSTSKQAITSSACWIPSQSVSRKQQEEVLSAFAQHEELLMAKPNNCWDTASAAGDCASILYYPDQVDLKRGDGLWNKLGPAIEQILASGKSTNHCLTVLVDGEASVADVQARLENSAQDLLPYLVSDRPVTSLSDVFARIEYVSSPQQALEMCLQQQQQPGGSKKTAVATTAPKAATTAMTPANLAAARRLGIDARRRLDETMDTVRAACTVEGEMRLVSNFGELCRSALTQAQLDTSVRSPVAQQMKDYLHRNLEHSFSDLFEEQLVLLEAASFDAFKQKLSKVIISPNLPADMMKIAHSSVREFAKRASRMAPPGLTLSTIPTAAFRRRLKEYVRNRTLQARATNKFKPLPRKAISIGMHWLLPKPFGNDYRQDPWMVHATDDLTYVPTQKVTDVNPDQVATGTWRDAIVPLPAGNDMVYMQ